MDAFETDHTSIDDGTLEDGALEAGANEAGSTEIGTASEAKVGRSGATMTASEAIEKIRRGELIERTRIVGLTLKGEFSQPVRFREVTLVQLVIEKASFAEEVAFEHCTLERLRFNRKSQFEKGLSLSGSTLIKAHFRGMTVKGSFRCDTIRTRGRFLVEASRLEGRLRFWEAQFHGWVDFKKCEFLESVDFRSIHVDEGFVVNGCRFHGDVLLRGATVHKKVEADASRFEGLVDVSKAKFHDFVYLEGIEQGESQRFAFTNALADRILIRSEQLEGRLASEEKGDYAQAMQEYGLLKRIFEGLHRYEQEDWAFYRFKVNQRRCKARSWRQPWTMVAERADWLLLDQSCGYGTNPSRAVRAALVIIIGFALIYALGINSFYVENEHEPFTGPQTRLANRLMIGTLTSVSAFTSGFGDLRDAASGWMNVPLIVESLLGTLLWGLFIVAFSRKVIR